jgi:hypothetical protein
MADRIEEDAKGLARLETRLGGSLLEDVALTFV